MDRIERIKNYMELCGVNQKELKDLGELRFSKPFLCDILNYNKPMNKENEKEIYRAINKARAIKLMGMENKENE